MQTLTEYIKEKYNGNQREFAKAQNVQPPQVTQWLKKDVIVIDDVMYFKRRELSNPDFSSNAQSSST